MKNYYSWIKAHTASTFWNIIKFVSVLLPAMLQNTISYLITFIQSVHRAFHKQKTEMEIHKKLKYLETEIAIVYLYKKKLL